MIGLDDEFKPSLAPNRGKGRGALNEFKDAWATLGVPAEWDMPWQDPKEMYWTPDRGWLKIEKITPEILKLVREKTNGCFHYHDLITQCRILEIQYEKVSVKELIESHADLSSVTDKGIEALSLEYFRRQGWIGDRCEGSTIKLMIYLIDQYVESSVKKKYGSRKIVKNKNGVRKRVTTLSCDEVTNQKLEIERRYDELMIEGFNYFYPSRLNEAHDWWARNYEKHPLPKCTNPNAFNKSDFIDLALAIGGGKIWKILELHRKGYGGFGWPDLTLYKDGELRFVEVKLNKDKFTEWQPYWVRNVARQLGFNVSVLHVVKN